MLDPHTLSHVLTELADWQREEGFELARCDVEEQLRDAGYGKACFDQVWAAFDAGRERPRGLVADYRIQLTFDAHDVTEEQVRRYVAAIEEAAGKLDLSLEDSGYEETS